MADPSKLSIAQLKSELMELNDSSFVFNHRDELECALKSARTLQGVKSSVGLGINNNSSERSGTSDVSLSMQQESMNMRSTSSSAISAGSSSSTAQKNKAAANTSDNENISPDLTSVGSASRGSSVSASSSPASLRTANRKSSREGKMVSPVKEGEAEPAPATTAKPTTAPSPGKKKTEPGISVDIFNNNSPKEEEEEPEPEDNNSISRRLVEYFVMVSCLPVNTSDNAKANIASKKLTKTRPPDPARDNLNSRTKGRFDVRKVHLSASTNSSSGMGDTVGGDLDTPDYSTGASSSAASSNNNTTNVGATLLEPKITARYPPRDYPDQPLNLRLPQFCHPEGTDLIHPTTEYKMPRVHHFVLTDSMGGKQYGTALTVYEEFKDYDALLRRRSNEDLVAEGVEQLLVGMAGTGVSKGKKKKKTVYYAPRVLCLLSTYPYLTAFRTYLTQLYRIATSTNVMTVPIERYIQNICAEVPAPPPGAFEVSMNILGSDIRFWAPPANQPIAYVSLPFQVLFECLDIGNILFAWYTLACERKVLLVSSQLSLLTVCSEILCSLLFPMKWSHLYIPVLPRSLSPMLDAPMPYLCGISRTNFPYAVEDISDETVVVDLDRNVITLGPNTPDLPPLPHNRRKKLEGTLKSNAGEVFWEARNLTKADVLKVRASKDDGTLSNMLDKAGAVWEEKVATRDDAFNLAYAPDSVSMQIDEDANVDLVNPKQSRWDAVQEAFLRFYVSLLQDYRKFLPIAGDNEDALQERSSWRGGPSGLSNLRFQIDEFVVASPNEFQPFLEELTMTQQFDDFVTRKMHNAADAPDIKFFDQSIDAKKNRSKLKLKKKETPFLHSAFAHRDLKRVQAVEPTGEGLQDGGVGNGIEEGKYLYKMWPVTFDDKLFGTPRPIPSIISAEFDRRGALQAMLRSKYGIVDESRGLGGRNNSPEVTTFILFFATFTSVIGKELSSVEQKHGTGVDNDGGFALAPGGSYRSPGTKRQSLTNLDDDMEVARTVAKAQIDLGYHTLALMRMRKLQPEPITYKLLIQACGRCKVTHRASGLMEMLARDGLATNSEIYTSLIAAFSNDNDGAPSSLALYQMRVDDNMSSLSSSEHGSSSYLIKPTASRAAPSERSLDLISEGGETLTTSTSSKKTIETSATSTSSKKSIKNSISSKLSLNKQKFKSNKSMSKRGLKSPRIKKQNLKVTAPIAKQIDLGESLLESLYPSVETDTENICPKCAAALHEDDISRGWTPCASNEYQTKCTSCFHKFVPKFSVKCKSPSFKGSQGKGTPLYCDFLSPWVLLREIRSVIAATGGGIDSILDEKFRSGPDISATLWWNMVVTFRKYKLPFIFLLQGSFHNNLILPSPSLNESMSDIGS